MMKKRLFLMAALILISGASMAQKVVIVGGKAVIDNRDMPTKAITMAKKAQITDATNTAKGTDDLSNLGSAESNKTVSHYFEVMKTDYNNGATMTWAEAIDACANYDDNTWRLPTQRELMLIWTLHVPLKNKVIDFTLFYSGNYWSATEFSEVSSWYVSFRNGYVYGQFAKAGTNRVRCVRDVTP